MERAKILIVDDQPGNLLALQAVLRSPGYELVEADTGTAAVNLCHEFEFALIVLDVHMPGMDGYQAARLIKKSGRNTEVPIMFLTATYREEPHMKQGYDAGAIDYVGKPFDPDILKAKVNIYADLYLKTKRLRETEALLESRSQVMTLLNAMPVGVVVVDSAGKIFENNEEAIRIFGGMTKSFDQSFHASNSSLTKTLEAGAPAGPEIVEFRNEKGDPKKVSGSSYPLRDQHGQVLGAVVVLQDITQI